LRKSLILRTNRPKGTRAKVYAHTLDFIAKRLQGVVEVHFTNNQTLLKAIQKAGFSTVVYTNNIPHDTVVFLKGLGLVQICLGFREDLSELADVTIDPLIAKSHRFLAGPDLLLPSALKITRAKDIARILGMPKPELEEKVSHNQAEYELLSVARLYRKLEWDSEFFGVNIGYISCLRLTPNIERHVRSFARREKLDMIEYRCNCHDRESVITSSKTGYIFVDMRLGFERMLEEVPAAEERPGFSVEKGRKKDVKQVTKIATDIYKDSRYYFDTEFDRNKVVLFYRDWARKAILGTFDDFAYVLYNGKRPIGFSAIKRSGRRGARISLFGLDAKYRGAGLARYLLNTVLKRLYEEEGVNYVEVVTQGRNYSAQRLYQKCGFLTKYTQLWYHKWFR